MIVWCSGQYSDGQAVIAADDRGFTLGDGVFETIAISDGHLEYWPDHRERLLKGLRCLDITPPKELALVPEIAKELWDRNQTQRRSVVRITISRGRGGQGLNPGQSSSPSISVVLKALATPAQGKRSLFISKKYNRYRDGFESFKFIGGYGQNIGALAEAKSQGATDALLLSPDGKLVCATSANVYIVQPSGNVFTPPECDGALPGVIRKVLLQRSKHVQEKSLAVGELKSAIILLSNSVVGIVEGELIATPTNFDGNLNTYEDLNMEYHQRQQDIVNELKRCLRTDPNRFE
ncbi:MAG: aminotransferase class IV [Pseudomonadota bacterium]